MSVNPFIFPSTKTCQNFTLCHFNIYIIATILGLQSRYQTFTLTVIFVRFSQKVKSLIVVVVLLQFGLDLCKDFQNTTTQTLKISIGLYGGINIGGQLNALRQIFL